VDAEYAKCDCTSFGEVKMLKLAKQNGKEFVDLTKNLLARTYPKGGRVDSSNYNPVPFWNVGAQLVALNYQTSSEPMWLNRGKFMVNGNSGYVLKPEFMNKRGRGTFNPDAPPTGLYKKLKVTVISGHQLPKQNNDFKGNIIDPIVVVSVCGIDADTKQVKTKPYKNNGFNPIWNEDFEFSFQASQLAMLTFAIDTESGKDTIGSYSVPVETLRAGMRVVRLWDNFGRVYPLSFLVVRFVLTPFDTNPRQASFTVDINPPSV